MNRYEKHQTHHWACIHAGHTLQYDLPALTQIFKAHGFKADETSIGWLMSAVRRHLQRQTSQRWPDKHYRLIATQPLNSKLTCRLADFAEGRRRGFFRYRHA
jgi:hypothetical protein